jgi:hypothetical protein
LPERLGVHKASRRRKDRSTARDQASAPANQPVRQVANVDAEHVVNVEAGPDRGEILDALGKRLLPRRQIRGIDASG